LGPSICWWLPLASLPLLSHTPDSLHISVGASALYRNRTVAPHSINGCHVARLPASAFQPAPLRLVVPLRLLVVVWHCWAPPFVGCCLWPPSLSHYTRPPDSLRISVGAYALYCNRTVAPHSINGCHVARLPASAFQPAPLPLVVPLHLLVVAWHRWAPPFVGCCLWPPSLSHYTRLRLLAAAAAGGCCRELLPPKPRPRPPPAIVIAIPPSPAILIAFPPSSPHRPGSG
jgi:hypothetical protein